MSLKLHRAGKVLGLSQKQIKRGWPQDFHLEDIAELQFPDSARDKSVFCSALESDCMGGSLKHRTAIERRPGERQPVYGTDITALLRESVRDRSYEVTVHYVNACDLALWLERQGEKPSTHLAAWIEATTPEPKVEPVVIAQTGPLPTPNVTTPSPAPEPQAAPVRAVGASGGMVTDLLIDYAREDLKRFFPPNHYWLREHDPIADRELTEPLLREPIRFGLTPRERAAASALGSWATYRILSNSIWATAYPARDRNDLTPEIGTTFDQEREIWGRSEVFRQHALIYARMLGDVQLIENYQTPSPTPEPQDAPVVEAPASEPKAKRTTAFNDVLPYLQTVYRNGKFKTTNEFIRKLERQSGEVDSPFKKAARTDMTFYLKSGGKSVSHSLIADRMKFIR